MSTADEDAIQTALEVIAGLDTFDVDLRNHPKAWAALEVLRTYASEAGRKDQRAAGLSGAAFDVLSERDRQLALYSHEHDDEHIDGEIPHAAACYALMAGGTFAVDPLWPKGWGEMKAKPHRRMLVVAAALLLAEIERLDRAAKEPA